MVRFKNRYLLLEIMPDSRFSLAKDTINSTEIFRALWDSIADLYGDYGAGAAKFSISVKIFNEKTKVVLVRIARDCQEMLAAAIPFVTKLGKVPAVLKTLHIGGSIRSCEKALVKHHRLELHSAFGKAQTDSDRNAVRAAINAREWESLTIEPL